MSGVPDEIWTLHEDEWIDGLGFADCVCCGGPCARCGPVREERR